MSKPCCSARWMQSSSVSGAAAGAARLRGRYGAGGGAFWAKAGRAKPRRMLAAARVERRRCSMAGKWNGSRRQPAGRQLRTRRMGKWLDEFRHQWPTVAVPDVEAGAPALRRPEVREVSANRGRGGEGRPGRESGSVGSMAARNLAVRPGGVEVFWTGGGGKDQRLRPAGGRPQRSGGRRVHSSIRAPRFR